MDRSRLCGHHLPLEFVILDNYFLFTCITLCLWLKLLISQKPIFVISSSWKKVRTCMFGTTCGECTHLTDFLSSAFAGVSPSSKLHTSLLGRPPFNFFGADGPSKNPSSSSKPSISKALRKSSSSGSIIFDEKYAVCSQLFFCGFGENRHPAKTSPCPPLHFLVLDNRTNQLFLCPAINWFWTIGQTDKRTACANTDHHAKKSVAFCFFGWYRKMQTTTTTASTKNYLIIKHF